MSSRRAARIVVYLNLGLLYLGLSLPLHRIAGEAGARAKVPAEVELPATLQLQWVRELPPPQPAWPDQAMMPFDYANRPAAWGRTLFVPCARTDSVAAYDVESGEEKWRFVADGPVRCAPVADDGRVYFTSDDGRLYCLNGETGALQWQCRGGPADRLILGNERLISTWPARGAPALAGNTVYFAAGIWPFMGIFLHARDARTGEAIWTNDGDGSTYIKQPHQADAFAGVAPQGKLVLAGERLLVPGGRSVPACYDRRTGQLQHFRLADNSKLGGGSEVQAAGSVFLNGGALFDLRTGQHLTRVGEPATLVGDWLHSCVNGELRAFDLRKSSSQVVTTIDRKGKPQTQASYRLVQSASVPLRGAEVLLKSGSRLYAGLPGLVAAFQLPLRNGDRPCWVQPIPGRPADLLAAADRLFVSTREGRLFCLGAAAVEPVAYPADPTPPVDADDWTARAKEVLDQTGVRAGWCIAWGVGSGRLIAELARQSDLNIVAIEPDAERAAVARRDLSAAGLYGERVAVWVADPLTVELPPYAAALMVSEDMSSIEVGKEPEFVRKVFQALRPYGGVACLPASAGQRSAVRQALAADAEGQRASLREAGDWLLLTRDGPLPDAGDWTHEHANAANTRVSRDRRVIAPLGLLWFGGTTNEGVLPRHGHGPQPQVVEGRAFIEGVDFLRAIDIYTGRLLWQAALPGVGKAFDNMAHQPGANAGGANYVSLPDGIYIAHGKQCKRLDPATGREMAAFPLPPAYSGEEPPEWDFVTVCDRYLIGGSNSPRSLPKGRPTAVSSSQYLTALDRHTGQVLWTAQAENGFRHNALCAGGGRLYVVDRASADHLAWLGRRGLTPPKPARLLAFDIATGKLLWSSAQDVFGTWLSYSEKRDVLVESGRVARDTLADEPKGMRAYDGARGHVRWFRKDYVGPALIHGDVVLRDKGACDLLTGAPVLHDDPLTGRPLEWTWTRNYGCNTPMASEHLLTFRSGAAGYYDLRRDGGTGNFGGFRSGCTNNLLVAGGLLVAPDYTRQCTCGYQNQTSLALVPMPAAEMWTFTGAREVAGPLRRIGINLGAPGSRRDEAGTLWLEYPPAGGPSPRVPVQVAPADVQWFRHHAASVAGEGVPWVAASGARGLTQLTLSLGRDGDKPRPYTVRLHFIEPDQLLAGARVFDVEVQGLPAFAGLDISREAGGPGRALVKEIKGVQAGRDLKLRLKPTSRAAPVLCGVEAIAEGW